MVAQWESATDRTRPGGAPAPLAKLDWYFTRGLGAADPEIVPAVDADRLIAAPDCGLIMLDRATALAKLGNQVAAAKGLA